MAGSGHATGGLSHFHQKGSLREAIQLPPAYHWQSGASTGGENLPEEQDARFTAKTTARRSDTRMDVRGLYQDANLRRDVMTWSDALTWAGEKPEIKSTSR